MGTQFLKVGVVGCGYVVQNGHIPALLKCKDVRLVAVCDKNIELAAKVAKNFKLHRYYADLEQMLVSEKLDVVDICTPIQTHAPLAIQAMGAGCHVFTEKPMALNTAGADAMIEAAHRNKVKLSVNHQLLFTPTVQKMKSLVDKGVIGNLIRVEIVQSTPPQDYPAIADPNHWYHKLPGGIHADNLPHPIYLIREFLGNIEPIAVYPSKMGSLGHLRPDEIQIVIKGERGNGTIISSCNYPSLWAVNVFGTKKNIYGDLNNSYVIVYEGKSKAGMGIPTLYARENLSRSFQILSSTLSVAIKLMLGKHRGLPIAIAKFIESIQKDTPPPVTPTDGREVVRVWEKIISEL